MRVEKPRFNEEDGFVLCEDCPWEDVCIHQPCPTAATYESACRLAEQAEKGE